MKSLLRLLALVCAVSLARAEVAYVTTDGDDKVARVGSTGSVSDFIASGLVNPRGIVFDEVGNAYVANLGVGGASGYVLRVAAGGGPSIIASNLNGPTGLALDADGALYIAVSGANQIQKLVIGGTPTLFATLDAGSNPQGIAFSPDGELFVACRGLNKIVKITEQGSVSTFGKAGDVTAPVGVAFTTRGIFAVGGGANGVIAQFNPNGNNAKTFLGGFTDARSITADRFDNLYVVNGGDNSLKLVTPAKELDTLAEGLADPQFVAVRGARFDVVVANGDAVLLEEGKPATFAVLGQPTVAATGDVAYSATLAAGANVAAGTGKSIWRDALGGTRTLIARVFSVAPGTGQIKTGPAFFATFSDPVVNADGKVAFRATTRGGDTVAFNTSGIWSDVGGTLDLAVRAGEAPGGVTVPGDEDARFTAFSSLFLPDVGLPIFQATIAGPGITTADNSGIWQATTAGPTQLLLRKGQSFVFGSKTVKLTAFAALKPVPFAGGQSRSVAPDGGVTVLATFSDLSKAVLRVRAGSTVVLARKGDAVTVPATTSLTAVFPPAISALGDVAWRGTLKPFGNSITAANAACIFQDALNGTRTVVAQAGTLAGGTARNGKPAASFATFSDPVINENSQVAFRATLKAGTGDAVTGNTIGLFSNSRGAVTVVARQGDTPPALDAGVKFTAFNSYVLLDTGGIATLATIAGTGIDTTNNQGIWAVDVDGAFQKILQKKDKVDVNGASKTIASLKIFTPLPFVAGQGRSYASTGDLALLAGFTDGSQAIVRVVFP